MFCLKKIAAEKRTRRYLEPEEQNSRENSGSGHRFGRVANTSNDIVKRIELDQTHSILAHIFRPTRAHSMANIAIVVTRGGGGARRVETCPASDVLILVVRG